MFDSGKMTFNDFINLKSKWCSGQKTVNTIIQILKEKGIQSNENIICDIIASFTIEFAPVATLYVSGDNWNEPYDEEIELEGFERCKAEANNEYLQEKYHFTNEDIQYIANELENLGNNTNFLFYFQDQIEEDLNNGEGRSAFEDDRD